MGDILQFVDSISAAPTVLLDLNNETPLAASGFSAPPPPLRRNASGGSLTDGDLVTADSYGDRTISLTLELFTTTQDLNAATLQTLARLINQNGAWLKWQPVGMTAPVFFRTKRANMSTVNEIVAATAMREIVLDLPAEPFAYGLAESSSFTVENDLFVNNFGSTVKGDVATPLYLDFVTPGSSFHNIAVASAARTDGVVQTVAYTKFAATGAPLTQPGGFTSTDVSEASCISGERRTVVRAAAGTYTGANQAAGTWSGLPRGDYRVLVRARISTTGTVDLKFTNSQTLPSSVTQTSVVNGGAVRTGWDWYDLGVSSMPYGAPVADNAFGLGPATFIPSWILTVATAAITTCDLDTIMLVPVGGASGVVSAKWAAQSADTPASAVATVVLDGVSDRRFMYVNDASLVVRPLGAMVGDLPVVVPGASNTIHFLRTLSQNVVGKGQYDDKDTSTVVNWKYFPRYLYTRPAST